MNITKTGAAFGLAALTLASSLSIGAAASAAPAPAQDSKSAASKLAPDHILVPYVVKNPDGTYWAGQPSLGGDGRRTPNTTRAAAEAAAENIQIPRVGTEGSLLTEDGNSCLFVGGNGSGRFLQRVSITSGYCSSDDWGYRFRVAGDGTIKSVTNPTFGLLSNASIYTQPLFDVPSSSNPESKLSILNTEVASVDVYNRTAVIKGWAQPGSQVEVSVGTTKNKQVTADSVTGEWTTTVRGLELGANKGTLETFDDNGDSLGESEFTVDVPITNLDATVLDTHVGLGTADVEITGTPGLDIIYQGKKTTLNEKGKKTVTFDSLQLGPNDVTIQQFDGDKQIGADLKYKINVMVKKITAEAAFDSRGDNFDAIVSGKSESNADISIIDSKGHETNAKASPQGVWSAPVKAPGTGRQTFEVSQSINGGDGGSTDTNTLDYGNGVEINTPRNNSELNTGPVKFTGDGQYQAVVEIFEKGNDKPLTQTKGLNSGVWNAEIDGVNGDYKHTYTARMHSKGNLTTEDTVTINPDKDEESAGKPFTILGPTENQQIVQPNGRVDFTGEGRVGEPIHVETSNGVTLGDGKVEANGTWTVSTWRKVPADYTVDVTMGTGATAVKKTVHYSLKLTEAVTMPFAIDAPTEGSTITDARGHVTFQGKGKAGAKVQAVTKSGANLGSAEVHLDGTWTIESWRPMASDYTVNITQSGTDVTPETKTVHYKLQLSAAVNKPFRIIAPTEGAALSDPTGLVTFSGEGTAKAKIDAVRGNGSSVGSTEVGTDGTWTIKAWLPNNADYTVKITQDGGNEKVVKFHFEKK